MGGVVTGVGTGSGLSTELQPFALAGPVPAQASILWDWRYTGAGVTAGGTLTTASTRDADGYYQISGITGARNGAVITTLEPAGDAIPGNEGYPVDDLIDAGGQLSANGFGYETADGNYANPYYANYLTPPIDQEVFTQPASSGFAEVPIDFAAVMVPGVTIATVVPGRPSDALRLVVVDAPTSGVLSLDGTSVQYLPGNASPVAVRFSFDVQDQQGGTTPVITVIASGSGSQKVFGALSGYTDISLGDGDSTVSVFGVANTVYLGNGNQFVTALGGDNSVTVGDGNSVISLVGGGNTVIAGAGNDLVTLAGSGSTVTLGDGVDIVRGGVGNTINLENTTLSLYGADEMVFVGRGDATINDFSAGLHLTIGPGAGVDVLSHFASDPSGVVDLAGGVGGFVSAAAAVSALTSDGHGGSLLSFGSGGSLDFTGVAASRLHAWNFKVG